MFREWTVDMEAVAVVAGQFVLFCGETARFDPDKGFPVVGEWGNLFEDVGFLQNLIGDCWVMESSPGALLPPLPIFFLYLLDFHSIFSESSCQILEIFIRFLENLNIVLKFFNKVLLVF